MHDQSLRCSSWGTGVLVGYGYGMLRKPSPMGPQLQHLQLILDISGGQSTSLQPGHFIIYWFSTSALNTTCFSHRGIHGNTNWGVAGQGLYWIHVQVPETIIILLPIWRDKLNRYGGCHVYHIQSRKNTKSYENCGDGSCPTVHICSAELAQWTRQLCRPFCCPFSERPSRGKKWHNEEDPHMCQDI